MTNGHLTDARSKGDGSSIDEKLETWQTNLKFQRWVALLRYLATWRYEALREPALHYLTKLLLSIKTGVFFPPYIFFCNDKMNIWLKANMLIIFHQGYEFEIIMGYKYTSFTL